MKEKRQFVRTDGLVLVDYKGERVEGKSSVFDISSGGMRLICDRKLDIDFQVELEFYLPGDSQPLKAAGKVVWVRERSGKSENLSSGGRRYFYTGIKLAFIDENNRNKIRGFIRKNLS